MGDSASKGFGDQFVGKLQTELNNPAPVYGKSLFTGAGQGTKNAWNYGTDFGKGLVKSNGFGTGQREAMTGFGGLADTYGGLATAYDPNSSAYKTLRQGIIDDTLSNLGSQFTASGRFGGGSYVDTASQGLGDALAGLDYTNMQRNIDNQYRAADSQAGIYSGQFGMGQQALTNQQGAISGLGQIGAAKDANTQGIRLGEADLYDRTDNANLDRLGKVGAIFGDPTAAANEPPWWQQALGWGANTAGNAVKAWWQ